MNDRLADVLGLAVTAPAALVVAWSVAAQWARGPLGWRASPRRAIASHRPGARSRCRGDRGTLPGLQRPSFSSAVRHFQGRLASNSISGLNWKRPVRRFIGRQCPQTKASNGGRHARSFLLGRCLRELLPK